MRNLYFSGACVMALALCGCASTPNVIMRYYFPMAQTDVMITQTVGCYKPVEKKTDDKKADTSVDNEIRLKSTSAAMVTTTYVTDYDGGLHEIKFRKFDNFFGDSDTSIGLTPDGRLTTFNASNIGQGSSIIAASIKLAAAAHGGLSGEQTKTPLTKSGVCELIKTDPTSKTQEASAGNTSDATGGSHPGAPPAAPPGTPPVRATGDQSKPEVAVVTLSFKGRLQFVIAAGQPPVVNGNPLVFNDQGQAILYIPADSGTETFQTSMVRGTWPETFEIVITPKLSDPKDPKHFFDQSFSTKNGFTTYPGLEVPTLLRYHLAVYGPTDELKPPDASNSPSATPPLWQGDILVPTRQATYLPVTAAPLFGRNSTALSVGDSGIVQKLGYGKTSGLADSLGAGSQVLVANQPPTDAQKAASYQAQSDLIYQQQRYIACQLSAKACPSK